MYTNCHEYFNSGNNLHQVVNQQYLVLLLLPEKGAR